MGETSPGRLQVIERLAHVAVGCEQQRLQTVLRVGDLRTG
jgi:hypothetical protein